VRGSILLVRWSASARTRGRRAGAGLSGQADPGDRISAAAGISDIFMRTVSEEAEQRWGQPMVIENRAGGGMNIGGRARAEAAADGTTLCIMSNEVVTY
jgi:tripartite-type tricarboxylate transporter receptor subunit TctC